MPHKSRTSPVSLRKKITIHFYGRVCIQKHFKCHLVIQSVLFRIIITKIPELGVSYITKSNVMVMLISNKLSMRVIGKYFK